MSTRNQKRKKIQQESTGNVSETLTSPVLVEIVVLSDQNHWRAFVCQVF